MNIRLARKIAYTRRVRRGTIIRALRRLHWGEYAAANRWWHWDRVRAVMGGVS